MPNFRRDSARMAVDRSVVIGQTVQDILTKTGEALGVPQAALGDPTKIIEAANLRYHGVPDAVNVFLDAIHAVKTEALSDTSPADEVQHISNGVRHDTSPSMNLMMEQHVIELVERSTGKLKEDLIKQQEKLNQQEDKFTKEVDGLKAQVDGLEAQADDFRIQIVRLESIVESSSVIQLRFAAQFSTDPELRFLKNAGNDYAHHADPIVLLSSIKERLWLKLPIAPEDKEMQDRVNNRLQKIAEGLSGLSWNILDPLIGKTVEIFHTRDVLLILLI